MGNFCSGLCENFSHHVELELMQGFAWESGLVGFVPNLLVGDSGIVRCLDTNDDARTYNKTRRRV